MGSCSPLHQRRGNLITREGRTRRHRRQVMRTGRVRSEVAPRPCISLQIRHALSHEVSFHQFVLDQLIEPSPHEPDDPTDLVGLRRWRPHARRCARDLVHRRSRRQTPGTLLRLGDKPIVRVCFSPRRSVASHARNPGSGSQVELALLGPAVRVSRRGDCSRGARVHLRLVASSLQDVIVLSDPLCFAGRRCLSIRSCALGTGLIRPGAKGKT